MSNASVVATRRAGPWSWWFRGAHLFIGDLRRRWYVFAAVVLIWVLAGFRLFVHHMPLLPVMFNWTPSIPYRMVYVQYGAHALLRGDLIVYRFAGPAGEKDYPGLRAQPFFKRVVGLPGDRITVVDRDVFINGAFVGRAKTHAFDRRVLEPIAPTVIPTGYLYVQGTGVDSFDSRYRSSGLVATRDVEAKVHPLF